MVAEHLRAAEPGTLLVLAVNGTDRRVDEDLFVNLSNVNGGTIADGSGRLLIVDNDGAMLATAIAAGTPSGPPIGEDEARGRPGGPHESGADVR